MHLTIFVWGLTAILGRLISLPADQLVTYRLFIVVLVMGSYARFKGLSFRVSRDIAARLLISGILVALHWLLFYGCIKYAGVAVAVLCLSSISLFTALFEPFVFGSKISKAELLFGTCVMVGVSFLVKLETQTDFTGLAMGVGSALFSAAFGTMNGKLAREVQAEIMTTYELSAALVVTALVVAFRAAPVVWPSALSGSDVGLLLTLSILCTVLPWLWSLRVLQTLRPYALALALCLETVYAMGLAWIIFPSAERLTWRFYVGSFILLLLVAANTWHKSRAVSSAPDASRIPGTETAVS
jgi:drug/metabolite transporter (DMT)-like permease